MYFRIYYTYESNNYTQKQYEVIPFKVNTQDSMRNAFVFILKNHIAQSFIESFHRDDSTASMDSALHNLRFN